MATFNKRISVVIDVVTDKATKGFKDFRTAVGEANGFTGKLKAGVGSLSSTFLTGAASTAAMGTAVVAAGKYAADAINDYANLGEQVGNFAQASGLSAEAASRWLEVSGDLGVEIGSLESTLGKLSKNVDPEKFDKLGVSIARTADGSVDLNQTFLNVIDRLRAIKDPAERARVGAQLLGKSWQSVAPLISRSADEIKSQLEDVASVKVFDNEKIKKSQDYKKAMADFGDAVNEVSLRLGEELLPVVTDILGPISDLVGFVGDFNDLMGGTGLSTLTDAWSGFKDWWNDTGDAIQYTGKSITNFGDGLVMSNRYLGLNKQHVDDVNDSYLRFHERATSARNALKQLQDQIAGRADFVHLQQSLSGNAKTIKQLEQDFHDNKITAEEYYNGVASAALDSKAAVADYVAEVDSIPEDKKLDLVARLDPASPGAIVGEIQHNLDTAQFYANVVGRVTISPATKKEMEGGIDVPKPTPTTTTTTGKTDTREPGKTGASTKESVGTGLSRSTPVPVNITVNVPPGANVVEIGRVTADALAAFYRSGGERP